MTANESEPIEMPAEKTDDESAERDDETLELAAQVELLEEENRRLRTEYARAKQSKYRRTAYGLLALGGVTMLFGALVADGREVLFALGGTGLFGGVLTLYLTPTRFVAAAVTERVSTALSTNYRALAEELGLAEQVVYLPSERRSAQLYLPQSPDYDLPELDDGPVVTAAGSRGLLLEATGALLFEEFEQSASESVTARPGTLATQLAEGVVEQFELADAVDTDRDPGGGRLTFRVSGSALGAVDRLDHPLTSFLAAGCATALDRPVTLDVTEDNRADWLVTLRWETESD
ncbi:hypothetical protein SAMN05216226_11914 [Halovenus aranensis]|uniref:DUF7982 domain-containing protein n=1 Tax=Halovenus aranensis TaxID=890420 RepID=A0A1G8Z8F6_9EURY|nr:hypothetical protein [Halovenus aranensis]SDK11369.1 hypothetical protein SAMN05216226_11914 [Halovenus aranensis]